ncbi:hypothetical protein TrVGV298_008425 [Trichoderma virens]|nr:hypothetical protein TrVGV298_008425 [Trichoderma virens]
MSEGAVILVTENWAAPPASEARIDSLHPAARASAAGRFSIAGNAVITGGTGAIAMVVSRAVLQHGASGLMLFDLNVDASRAAIQALQDEFPDAKIEAREVDVTDEEAVTKAIDQTVETLGSVDMLVCLAGIVGCAHALDMPISQWRRVLDVNTTGAFICARAAARTMVLRGNGGRIIFTASISAHRVNFPQPQVAYNASKGGVADAQELAGGGVGAIRHHGEQHQSGIHGYGAE